MGGAGHASAKACVALQITDTVIPDMGCAGSVESADREAVGGAGSNLTSNASHEATLAAAAIGGALGTFSMVDLSIAAKGLVSLDLMSASDPICVVYERRDGRLVELGRTEAICT